MTVPSRIGKLGIGCTFFSKSSNFHWEDWILWKSSRAHCRTHENNDDTTFKTFDSLFVCLLCVRITLYCKSHQLFWRDCCFSRSFCFNERNRKHLSLNCTKLGLLMFNNNWSMITDSTCQFYSMIIHWSVLEITEPGHSVEKKTTMNATVECFVWK